MSFFLITRVDISILIVISFLRLASLNAKCIFSVVSLWASHDLGVGRDMYLTYQFIKRNMIASISPFFLFLYLLQFLSPLVSLLRPKNNSTCGAHVCVSQSARRLFLYLYLFCPFHSLLLEFFFLWIFAWILLKNL